MKQVYLDMNVIVDCMKRGHEELSDAIHTAKDAGTIFPYSPAHMEEVANILRSKNAEGIAEEPTAEAIRRTYDSVEYISSLSDDWEYLPNDSGEIRLLKEHPQMCIYRVCDRLDLTEFAEENDREIQAFRDEKSFTEYFGRKHSPEDRPLFDQIQNHYEIKKKELGNIPPSELFDQNNIKRAFDDRLKQRGNRLESFQKYPDIRDSHSCIQSAMTQLFNFMEEIGYYSEKRKKYRSRMHDVTHSIYATKSDYFVIGDDRFRNKATAIYSFLEVPCTILSVDEFLAEEL